MALGFLTHLLYLKQFLPNDSIQPEPVATLLRALSSGSNVPLTIQKWEPHMFNMDRQDRRPNERSLSLPLFFFGRRFPLRFHCP